MSRKVPISSLINFLKLTGLLLLLSGIQPLLASPLDLNFTDSSQLEAYIAKRTRLIQAEPKNPIPYIERGDARFIAHQFDEAVDDYTAALDINDAMDEAYFGRGLALGRSGFIEAGIEDLGVYIKRNPKSSIAYTKRGIRYLWLGDLEKAKADFTKAIEINPKNAEAHDDLGVIFAKYGQYYQAADNFISAFEIDPSYYKAYYNLAIVSFITNKDKLALVLVKNSLALKPNSRDSLILKAKILKSLGRVKEAESIMDDAEFLPEGNWSERIPLK